MPRLWDTRIFKGKKKIDSFGNVKNACKEDERDKKMDCLALKLQAEEMVFETSTTSMYSSRVKKHLIEFLCDKASVGYLVQYLEAQNVLQYIRFWLDVESFHSSISSFHMDKSLHECSRKPCLCLREESHEYVHSNSRPTESSHVICVCSSLPVLHLVDNDMSHQASKAVNQPISRNLSIPTCLEHTENTAEPNANQCNEINRHFDVECTNVSQDIVNDALRIFDKYLSPSAPYAVDVDDDTRCRIMDKIYNKNNNMSSDCFVEAQEYVFNYINAEYFEDFLSSNFHSKYILDILTSGDIALADILFNDAALFYLMEFLEGKGERRLLDFWVAADNFYTEMKNNLEPLQAQNDAMILYERYFSLQATIPLGFSCKMRIEIEHNICQEGGPDRLCFLKPVTIVMTILEKYYLKPFLGSNLFSKYIFELMNASQQGFQVTTNRMIRSDSMSTCSSATGTVNTLLAVNTYGKGGRRQSTYLDTASLDDSTKSYKSSDVLSLGYINELGNFVPQFEPEPDKKLGGSDYSLSRAMKKLVSLDNSQSEEESAMRMAESIIKDITDLTMGSADDDL